MAYDLTRVQKEFNEVCAAAGVSCRVPVTLNGRLTRTLGRVHSVGYNGYYNAESVEFSKQMLETCTDETIRDVIMHEAAHLIAVERTHEAHGHDWYFKAICAEIGTSNDGTHTDAKRVVPEASVYKYAVYCDSCNGAFIGGYSRMCRTLKEINRCTCRKCGKSQLRVVQNW